MYRRILVTLDGSPLAEQVLPHVKALLEGRSGVQLYLLSVAQVIDLATASAMVYPLAVYPGQPIDEAVERRRVEDELCNYLRGVEKNLTATRRAGVRRSALWQSGRRDRFVCARHQCGFDRDVYAWPIGHGALGVWQRGRSGAARGRVSRPVGAGA